MHNELSMTSRVCLLTGYLAAAVAGNILASHAGQTTRGLKGETGCYRQGPLWLKRGSCLGAVVPVSRWNR